MLGALFGSSTRSGSSSGRCPRHAHRQGRSRKFAHAQKRGYKGELPKAADLPAYSLAMLAGHGGQLQRWAKGTSGMTYEQERARAEARRWLRIADAHDKHVAAHEALREKHAAAPKDFAEYAQRPHERKALDDALGENVRQLTRRSPQKSR